MADEPKKKATHLSDNPFVVGIATVASIIAIVVFFSGRTTLTEFFSTPTPKLMLLTPSALPICSHARVKVKALSVREEAGVTKRIVQTIGEGTPVDMVCDSEVRQSGLYWVQIRAVLADSTVVVGWIPGKTYSSAP